MVLADRSHGLRRKVGKHASVDPQRESHNAIEVRAAHRHAALSAILSEAKG